MSRHRSTAAPATFDVFAALAAGVAGFDVEPLTRELGWRCVHCDGRLRVTHMDRDEWVQRAVLTQLVEAAAAHWCDWR